MAATEEDPDEASIEWVQWTPENATAYPEIAPMVDAFESIDTAAGADATRWLNEQALGNHGSTQTYLMIVGDKLYGYIAMCTATVKLTEAEVSGELDVPHRAALPAVCLTWIARARDSPSGTGWMLFSQAYGLAREVAGLVGACAFVLDPADWEIHAIWTSSRYGFLEASSHNRGKDNPKRLWKRLDPL